MRRAAAALGAVLLLIALATGVSASSASSVSSSAVVSTDGTCKVSVTVNLHLDSAVDKLYYPLPLGARGVTVNGTSVATHKSDGALQADISRLVKGLTGTFSLTFSYTLSGCVETDSLGRTIVTVPLLCGFSYPTENLSFNVTLPGEASSSPTFTSGYYQSSIESILEYSVSGQTVSGYSTSTLKDQETLSISIEMPMELFPQQQVQELSVAFDDIAMYVCAGLALVYWLIFLRCLPPRRVSCAIAPESYTAGELCSVLTAQGADLTMMVMTWAQLGYVLIHLDGNNRVMIHKRMEMGNERSGFENRVFRALFGKKQLVDGTSYHYASLCKKVRATPANLSDHFRRGSGNPTIFRVLACGIGVFGGMSLGLAMGKGSFLSGLTVFLMVTFGTVSAWLIQSGAYGLFLRERRKLWVGLGCCALWLLLGALAGEFGIAALVAAAEALAGLAAAYGGRRNDLGRQAVAQVLGLRRYLRKAPKGEFQRITRNAPDYFYSMAPYAQALGIGQQFAAQFGSMQLPGCPYLTTGRDGHRTAAEWMELMDEAVTRLDARQKRLLIERLMLR